MKRSVWLWAAGIVILAAVLGISFSAASSAARRPEKYIGFEIDIAQALARELNRPIELKQYEFSSMLAGLERGDFDMAMCGLEITPDRLKKVRFSRPYYIYKLQLVARSSETRFQSLADCIGRKDLVIGTLEDTAADRLLDKLGITKRIYPGQVEPYSDCALGRIDGVLLDWPIAIYHGNKDPKLQFVGDPIEPGYYAVALTPRRNGLKPQLDAAFERLLASGELQKIYEKWKLWTPYQAGLTTDAVRRAADAGHTGGAAPADDETSPLTCAIDAEGGAPYGYIDPEAHSGWSMVGYCQALGLSALVTIQLTLESMALAMIVGLAVALARLYGPPPVRALGLIYVEFFRGIPVILLLYFLYYGLPGISQQLGLPFHLNLNPFPAAVLGLGLNYAAYESEIYRAGISAIPVGQWEAASSLGMSGPQTFRRIILPQALRLILPPMTNDFVALFKDTSVVSVIAVVELSKEYQILSKSSLKYLELGAATACFYLLMSVPLAHLSRQLERKWSAGG
ncbi:ABC transporter substrate-binding protein/permease [soil metagenome]